MHDVGIEFRKVTANAGGQGQRQAIFRPPGDRDCRYVDEIAGRREGGLSNGWRVDANLHPLPQQIADEAIQRLVRTIAHIIVIARKQGHAEVAGLHGWRL